MNKEVLNTMVPLEIRCTNEFNLINANFASKVKMSPARHADLQTSSSNAIIPFSFINVEAGLSYLKFGEILPIKSSRVIFHYQSLSEINQHIL